MVNSIWPQNYPELPPNPDSTAICPRFDRRPGQCYVILPLSETDIFLIGQYSWKEDGSGVRPYVALDWKSGYLRPQGPGLERPFDVMTAVLIAAHRLLFASAVLRPKLGLYSQVKTIDYPRKAAPGQNINGHVNWDDAGKLSLGFEMQKEANCLITIIKRAA